MLFRTSDLATPSPSNNANLFNRIEVAFALLGVAAATDDCVPKC